MVSQAINKDKKAQEVLYRFTNKAAYFVALKMTKNEHDAMDIVQDSFLKAFSKLDTLKNPKLFPSWINQITANMCKDYFKKRRPDFFEDIKSGEDDNIEYQLEDFDGIIPSSFAEDKDVQRIIRNIIDNLADEQRLCVLMFYFDGMTIREIAENLNVSEGTVKSRLSYARKKMKDEIEKLSEKGTDLRGVSIGWLFRWCLRLEKNETKIPKGLLILDSSVATGLAAATVTSTLSTKIILSIVSAVVLITGGFGIYYYITNRSDYTSANTVVDSQALDSNEGSTSLNAHDSIYENSSEIRDTSSDTIDSNFEESSDNGNTAGFDNKTTSQNNIKSSSVDNSTNQVLQTNSSIDNTEDSDADSNTQSNSSNSKSSEEDPYVNYVDNDPSSYTYILIKNGENFVVLAEKNNSNELFIVKTYSKPSNYNKDKWAKDNFGYSNYDELVAALPIEVEYKPEYAKNF